jgi:transposase
VTYNPELKKAQMEGVLANIASCEKALSDLSERLRLRREGVITKGRKPTIQSTEKNVTNILSAEHMRDIFDYTVSAEPEQTPELTFSLNEERWRILQERSLGKSVLFTDHDDWTNEQIVSAYRSQYHVEEAFKQMKDQCQQVKENHPPSADGTLFCGRWQGKENALNLCLLSQKEVVPQNRRIYLKRLTC